MLFEIEIQETLSRVVEVEADNLEQAVSNVRSMYRNSDIILDSEDFASVDIYPTQESLEKVKLMNFGETDKSKQTIYDNRYKKSVFRIMTEMRLSFMQKTATPKQEIIKA